MHNDKYVKKFITVTKKASKYFDSGYYFAQRPDVKKAKINPFLHYITTGWTEGVNPSSKFNTRLYDQDFNPGKCPLLHFIEHGEKNKNRYKIGETPKVDLKKYFEYKKLRVANTVCYTYLSDNYDELISHKYLCPDWDYVCFTNNKKLLNKKYVGAWKIMPSQCENFDPKRNSGWHKTHPEILFPNYTSSVWVDGAVNILTDYVVNEINSRKSDLLVPIHDMRDCIYDECDANIEHARETVDNVEKVRTFLKKSKMPKKYGLNETNIVYRKHKKAVIKKIDNQWWDCIEKYSKRDQLSFSYVLYKNDILPKDIAINNTRQDAQNFFVVNHTVSNKKEYDIIYSIGRDCACSFYLSAHNLRACSGPMDWITTADFKQRFDMLLNDFDGFMDISNFEFLPKNPNIFNDEKCDYYRNIKTGFDFYHDFPKDIPLAKSFPAVAEKYNRRIQRFYEKIKKEKRVLLVWFSHYTKTNEKEIVNLCNKFCKKMHKNIDFLIIEHAEGVYVPQKKNLAPNIVKWDLHTIAKDENGVNIVNGNEALVNPIFNEYRLSNQKSLSKFQKFLYFVQMRIVCSLIPTKKWRHHARNHIEKKYKRLIR